MDAPTIAILVLLGAALVEGIVMGAFIWSRGKKIAALERDRCVLTQKVIGLERRCQRIKIAQRLGGITDEELLDELNSGAVGDDCSASSG